VVNNTLVNSDTGISIGGRSDLGASWTGVVANNVVSNTTGWGIVLDDPSTGVVNEHNLFFDTGMNYFTPGPNTLFVDPQFIGGGDYRLGTGSPARDAGSNTRLPGDIMIDLNGLARVQGGIVDLGAYESVPEPPTTVMLLFAAIACRFIVKRRG